MLHIVNVVGHSKVIQFNMLWPSKFLTNLCATYNWIQSLTTFVLSSKELKFDLKKEKIELSACMSAWQTENHNTWV